MARHSLIMLGWSWTDLSVMGSQLFIQASMESWKHCQDYHWFHHHHNHCHHHLHHIHYNSMITILMTLPGMYCEVEATVGTPGPLRHKVDIFHQVGTASVLPQVSQHKPGQDKLELFHYLKVYLVTNLSYYLCTFIPTYWSSSWGNIWMLPLNPFLMLSSSMPRVWR